MTIWNRPIPDPDAGPDAPAIAGGPIRFTRVELLERDKPARIVSVDEVDDSTFTRLSAPRPAIAGVTMDRPQIMGIVNVTPDSFSDGGRFLDASDAARQIGEMEAAAILDIGGESTRPGATEVDVAEEIARVVPVIQGAVGRVLSIDTRKSKVAEAAVQAGATIVNDVSAGTFDPDMLPTVARLGVPICLMHAQGRPETMQDDPRYGDVLFDILEALSARIAAAEAAGIARDRIIADPGIGFGKTVDHNVALVRRIGAFHDLGVPVLLGASRKRFIGEIGKAPQADTRLPGTLAVTLSAMAQGVQIHRVHDVAEIEQGAALWRAVTGGT